MPVATCQAVKPGHLECLALCARGGAAQTVVSRLNMQALRLRNPQLRATNTDTK